MLIRHNRSRFRTFILCSVLEQLGTLALRTNSFISFSVDLVVCENCLYDRNAHILLDMVGRLLGPNPGMRIVSCFCVTVLVMIMLA